VRAYAPLLVSLMAIAACGEDLVIEREPCSQGVYPPVVVQLYDQVADTLLLGGGRGEIRDGEFSDSLKPAIFNENWDVIGYQAGLIDGHSRPGVYSLTVERDGFRPVERRNIEARWGRCGVEPAWVRIDMERE
jgi:hypothetical protein